MLQKRLSVKHDVIIDTLDYLPLFLLVQLGCTTYVISVVNNLKNFIILQHLHACKYYVICHGQHRWILCHMNFACLFSNEELSTGKAICLSSMVQQYNSPWHVPGRPSAAQCRAPIGIVWSHLRFDLFSMISYLIKNIKVFCLQIVILLFKS